MSPHIKHKAKSAQFLTIKERLFGIAALTMAMPVIGVLFAQDAFAYTMLDGQTSINEQKGFIDRGISNSPIVLAASCNELNGIIDAVGNYQTNIFLEDNCQSNITIGANKKINLISRYYKSGSTYYETLANMNTDLPDMETYHYGSEVNNQITGFNNATLTVEEGATVIVDGFIVNTGGAAIENYGTLLLMGGALGAVKNHGTLYLGGGNYGDAEFQIDDASEFKIADGRFVSDNFESIRQNVANGAIISEPDETGGIKVTMPVAPKQLFDNMFIPVAIDVDMPYTLSSIRYPEIAEALLIKAVPSANGFISVSGSVTSGITLTGVSQNVIGLGFTNNLPVFRGGNNIKYQEVMSYKLSGEVSDARRQQINSIINEAFGDPEYGMIPESELKAALLGAGAMGITFNEHELDHLGVPQEDLEKLEALTADLGGTLVKFYDISASLVNSETLTNLMSLTDLGDNDSETFSIDIPEDLVDAPNGKTRTFQVYRVHDGEAEVIPSTRNGDKIVFATNKFSTYALGYKDVDEVKAPNTGLFTKEDGSANVENILLSLAGLSIAVFLVLGISHRLSLKSRTRKF